MSTSALPVGEATTAATRVRSVLDYLKSKFHERDEVIDGIGVALVAHKHMVQFGPPGTGKSMLTDALAALSDLRYFDQQFSQFTSEEDTFGPKDIKLYREEGRFNRHVEDFLPTAELYFADEIGKASQAVHDPLLKALNERVYRNGDEVIKLPLMSAMSASNEFFHDEPAFFDRFHIRFIVGYIKSAANFMRLLENPIDIGKMAQDPDAPRLAKADLVALRESARSVKLPTHIVESLARMRHTFLESGILISDRRFRDAVEVLQASAALNDRSAVDDDDLLMLQHMFWTEEKEVKAVRDVIYKYAGEFFKIASDSEMMLDEIISEKEQYAKLAAADRAVRLATLQVRVRKISTDLHDAIEKANREQRNAAVLKSVKAKADQLKQDFADDLVNGSR